MTLTDATYEECDLWRINEKNAAVKKFLQNYNFINEWNAKLIIYK